jgi:hypothetical protein
LKLLLAQMAWSFLTTNFMVVENALRERVVEYECDILEMEVPLTAAVAKKSKKAEAASTNEDEQDEED